MMEKAFIGFMGFCFLIFAGLLFLPLYIGVLPVWVLEWIPLTFAVLCLIAVILLYFTEQEQEKQTRLTDYETN